MGPGGTPKSIDMSLQARIKPQAAPRVGQPTQNKVSGRVHKRSLSQQNAMGLRAKTIDVSNFSKMTQENTKSTLDNQSHKRANSKDHSKLLPGKSTNSKLNST